MWKRTYSLIFIKITLTGVLKSVENIIFAIPRNLIVEGVLVFFAGPHSDSGGYIAKGSLENAIKLSPWKLFEL